ncbi:MAG: BrnT family toxin [Candidatus Riflebacteria bacterium]|nr:BrnT family toxin [Candidatus Riflebacteria bacterium]
MNISWDENKNRIYFFKHGFSFEDAEKVFEGETLTFEDDHFDYGEKRFIMLGYMEGRFVQIVHAESEDSENIRLISMRKGSKYEQKIYQERLKKN